MLNQLQTNIFEDMHRMQVVIQDLVAPAEEVGDLKDLQQLLTAEALSLIGVRQSRSCHATY